MKFTDNASTFWSYVTEKLDVVSRQWEQNESGEERGKAEDGESSKMILPELSVRVGCGAKHSFGFMLPEMHFFILDNSMWNVGSKIKLLFCPYRAEAGSSIT